MRNKLGFWADSVLKLSTAIDIFIKFPKNENLSHLRQIVLFNVALRKQFWRKTFGIWLKDFLSSQPLCEPLGVLKSKNSTKLPAENWLFWKTASFEKAALSKEKR